jgi:hypothetical protein
MMLTAMVRSVQLWHLINDALIVLCITNGHELFNYWYWSKEMNIINNILEME